MDDRGTRVHETSPAVLRHGRRLASGCRPAPAIGARPVIGAEGHRWALQIQRTLGNRALQRIVFDPQKTEKEVKAGTKKPFHDRPNEPHREIELEKTVFGGTELPQSRHHIIPWNRLSAFVRKAYEVGHIAELHMALSPAMRTMMSNSPRYVPGSRNVLPPNRPGGKGMQGALTLQDLTAELRKRPGADPNKEAVWAITSAFCWMPGNLFLGPLNTLRLDDPDEDFENHAADQVGPRFERFKQAFKDIKDYTDKPTVEAARKIASFLQSVAMQPTPIPFDERVWTRVENENGEGRYFLTKAADSAQVQTALQGIRAAKAANFETLVKQHNEWHAAQQDVWAQRAGARAAAVPQ